MSVRCSLYLALFGPEVFVLFCTCVHFYTSLGILGAYVTFSVSLFPCLVLIQCDRIFFTNFAQIFMDFLLCVVLGIGVLIEF